MSLTPWTPRGRRAVVYATRGFSASEDPLFSESERAFARVGLSLRHALRGERADVIVHKSSPRAMGPRYADAARAGLSVTDRGVTPMQIHINADNWARVPVHLGSEYTSLRDYRIALLSHEFAHAFGHDHVSCACVGCESDVRQQPSRALGGCRPTTRVVFHRSAPHSNVNFGGGQGGRSSEFR